MPSKKCLFLRNILSVWFFFRTQNGYIAPLIYLSGHGLMGGTTSVVVYGGQPVLIHYIKTPSLLYRCCTSLQNYLISFLIIVRIFQGQRRSGTGSLASMMDMV